MALLGIPSLDNVISVAHHHTHLPEVATEGAIDELTFDHRPERCRNGPMSNDLEVIQAMAQLSDTPVQLAAALAAQIIDHARAGKPEEICGIIRGRGLVAYEVIPGQNIADERIENYTVDPQTLLLQFQFEETGEEMMGIYHSHPVSVAYPSATDAWNAYYPDSIYFICSLEFDDTPVIRAFRMITHFVELDLATITETLPFYETRPGLFAYYQAADQTLPAALRDAATGIGRPFYMVYAKEDVEQPWQDVDVRLVELIEHPVATPEEH